MPATTTLIFPNDCWTNSVESMLPMPWGSHKAPVRLERCNGTMNRAAFCVADDFFDSVQNILATHGLAYGVQEPFDNASEPKNIHGSLPRSKPFIGPCPGQAQIIRTRNKFKKKNRLPGIADLYKIYVFSNSPVAPGFS